MISLVIPTRKRTKYLIRLFKNIEETCNSIDNVEVLLAIDDDDSETIGFIEEYHKSSKLTIKAIVTKRGRGYLDLHKKVNELCRISKGKLLLALADDIQFMNKNWDEKMLATYNTIYKDNIYWIRTSHTLEEYPFVQCPIITREWYEVIGHFGTCHQQDVEFNYVAGYVGREVVLKDIVLSDRGPERTGEVDQNFEEGRLSATSAIHMGRSVWSPEVKATIIADSIKLLKRIRLSASPQEKAEISARIRSLYWEYIRIKLRLEYIKIKLVHLVYIGSKLPIGKRMRRQVKQMLQWVGIRL